MEPVVKSWPDRRGADRPELYGDLHSRLVLVPPQGASFVHFAGERHQSGKAFQGCSRHTMRSCFNIRGLGDETIGPVGCVGFGIVPHVGLCLRHGNPSSNVGFTDHRQDSLEGGADRRYSGEYATAEHD